MTYIDNTYRAPVHERAASVGRRDGSERHWGVFRGLDMRDEMSTVQSAHAMRHEVDGFASGALLQQPIEGLRARRDRAGGRDAGDNDFGADLLPEDVQDVRPVMLAQQGEGLGSADVETVQS